MRRVSDRSEPVSPSKSTHHHTTADYSSAPDFGSGGGRCALFTGTRFPSSFWRGRSLRQPGRRPAATFAASCRKSLKAQDCFLKLPVFAPEFLKDLANVHF
jgi:hypothetical protein